MKKINAKSDIPDFRNKVNVQTKFPPRGGQGGVNQAIENMHKIIPYNKNLIPLANKLRKDMTFGEVLLWNELKDDKFWGFDLTVKNA